MRTPNQIRWRARMVVIGYFAREASTRCKLHVVACVFLYGEKSPPNMPLYKAYESCTLSNRSFVSTRNLTYELEKIVGVEHIYMLI